MKKLLSLALALCLIFIFASEALAAGLTITQQPESATTTKAGSVSFSITVKGQVSSYSWFFVNPETGKKTTGKKLAKSVKGVKVNRPNGSTISLENVPEKMHGWLVYCHVVSKTGQKIDSDSVQLLVYGMDPPESIPQEELVITKNPKDTKISKKGKVSFTVEYSGLASKITWAFINPKTGDKVIGKKILNRFKDLKISGVNKKKLTLSNVPESMAGWFVYAHLVGKGVEINTERATILSASAVVPKEKATPTPEPEPESTPVPDDQTVTQPVPDEQENTEPAAGNQAQPEEDTDVWQDRTIVISSSANNLRALDLAGNVVEGDPTNRLEFLNTGSFIISSDDPIETWTINGVRYVLSKPVREIKVRNVMTDMSVDIKIVSGTSSAQVDESHMCKVICTGCTFTYLPAGLRSVTEGEVPAGAPIRISADTPAQAKNGYSVNGGEAQSQGLASFQYVVTEDVEIVSR